MRDASGAFSFRLIPIDSEQSPESPRFYALQHLLVLIFRIVRKFPHFFLAVPNILLTFANANKDDSNLSGRATVSPMASQPQAFFMPKSIILLASAKRCTDMAAA